MTDAQPASNHRLRKWIIGLLVYCLLVNLQLLFRAAASIYQPASLGLSVQEHTVEIFRDRDGTPVFITARNPPNAYWTDANGFPAAAYYAMMSLVSTAVVLALYLRSTRTVNQPNDPPSSA